MLLVKPFNASNNDLIAVDVPVSLLDIAPTICAALFEISLCQSMNYEGKDFLVTSQKGNLRKRKIMMYAAGWKKGAEKHENPNLFSIVEFSGKARDQIPILMSDN